MGINEFSKALWNTLGEAGAEAVLDAINFYLLHADEGYFGCKEDKLCLLSILAENYRYFDIYKNIDDVALYNFDIQFKAEVKVQ